MSVVHADDQDLDLRPRLDQRVSEVVREDSDAALARWVGAKQGDTADIHDVFSSAVLHGSVGRAQKPLPRFKLQHAVQGMDSDVRLGRPTLVRARAKSVARAAIEAVVRQLCLCFALPPMLR